MGIGGALIPLASVMATLTLTPAILGGIGARRWRRSATRTGPAGRGALGPGVVRHRWLAAITRWLRCSRCSASSSGQDGVASSDSLAHNAGYDTLQVLERGGLPTGALTPMECWSQRSSSTSR